MKCFIAKLNRLIAFVIIYFRCKKEKKIKSRITASKYGLIELIKNIDEFESIIRQLSATVYKHLL